MLTLGSPQLARPKPKMHTIDRKMCQYQWRQGSGICTVGATLPLDHHKDTYSLRELSRHHNRLLRLLSEIRPQFQVPETEQAVSERTRNNGQSMFNTPDAEMGGEQVPCLSQPP